MASTQKDVGDLSTVFVYNNVDKKNHKNHKDKRIQEKIIKKKSCQQNHWIFLWIKTKKINFYSV